MQELLTIPNIFFEKLNIKNMVNRCAIWIAILSFLIGPTLFISHLISPSTALLVIGLYYVIFTILVNLATVLTLCIWILATPKNRKENLYTIAFLCLNIPIALGYYFIVISYRTLF